MFDAAVVAPKAGAVGKAVAQTLLGIAAGFWVAIPIMVKYLLALMGIDLAIGVVIALQANDVCRETMFRGLGKKAVVLLLCGAGHLVKDAAHLDFDLGSAIAAFYCLHELLSITKNAGAVGIPIPPVLDDVLRTFSKKTDGEKTRSAQAGK